MKVIGISFKKKGKIYYFDPTDIKINKNDNVVVNTERGTQFGMSETDIFDFDEKKINSQIKTVLRIASNEDVDDNKKNKIDSMKAIIDAKKLAEKHNLDMRIIDAEFTLDRSKLLIKFLADNRIDFRNLAKDLASIYKTRIELRQVGARDKAKEIGGCGVCGRQLCCSKFLNDLESVSINMAKNQNISLNPNKINGACGRLLCCLKYEDEFYSECRKKLPSYGQKIVTAKGEGKVVNLDILNESYDLEIKDIGIVKYNNNEKN